MTTKSLKHIGLLLAFVLFSSCEKVLEFEPEGSNLEEEEALSTKESVEALLNSAYESTVFYKGGQFQVLGDLLADNLEAPASNNDLDEVYRHNVLFFNTTVGNQYGTAYQAVLKANRVLEVVDDFDFTSDEIDRISGESLFLRAMAHFELVRLFAHPYGYSAGNQQEGIAYKTESEPKLIPRAAVQDVYNGIIEDLEQAEQLLPPSNGIYASKDAATALLAKVYFQQGEYQLAAEKAGSIIESGTYSLGTSVDRFVSDQVLPEVIYYFQSYLDTATTLGFFASQGFAGYRYVPALNINNPEFRATRSFYDTYAADTTDRRLDLFEIVNPGETNEFIATTRFNETYFNVPVLHLTEMKLIRAESLARLGTNLQTARDDLNDIRERAYGSDARNLSSSASANSILDAVLYERQIEMFAEGERIHQLKRYGAMENEAIEIRGDDWDCPGLLLQFPISERSEVFNLNPTGGC